MADPGPTRHRRMAACLIAVALTGAACGSEPPLSATVTATPSLAPATTTGTPTGVAEASTATVTPPEQASQPTPIVPLTETVRDLIDPLGAEVTAFFDAYFEEWTQSTEVGRLDLGDAIVLFRFGPSEESWNDEALVEPLIYGNRSAFDIHGGHFCRDFLLTTFRGASHRGVFYISWNAGQVFVAGQEELPLFPGTRPEWSLGVHVDADIDDDDVTVLDGVGAVVECDQSRG